MQKKTTIQNALLKKYPEPVALIATTSKEGKKNVMAVGWYAIVSDEPFMFAVCIDKEAYTYQAIKDTNEFVLAFPSSEQAKETLFVGTHHGHKIDKVKECGIKLEDATNVKAPLVSDAVANFECVKEAEYQPGNCPIIIGKVVAAYVNINPDLKRLYTVAKGYKLSAVIPIKE